VPSSSWAADDEDETKVYSEDETVSMPSPSASSEPEPYHDAEPIYMRRAPQPEQSKAYDEPELELEPVPSSAHISSAPVADVQDEPDEPAAAAAAEDDGAGPSGAVTQTIIFQAVPNFQAALALERSLKAMSEVREVRVADFDERQLTFQVTHELGTQLPRVLLSQRAGELEFVEAKPERVEFVFRS
jgi:hypothetical protein